MTFRFITAVSVLAALSLVTTGCFQNGKPRKKNRTITSTKKGRNGITTTTNGRPRGGTTTTTTWSPVTTTTTTTSQPPGATTTTTLPTTTTSSTTTSIPTTTTTTTTTIPVTTFPPAPIPPEVSCGVGRLRTQPDRFILPDGSRFIWRFASFFGGVDMVADGRVSEVDQKLAWFKANGVNGLRVFTMMDPPGVGTMFTMSPEDGRSALAPFLELACKHGLYIEVTVLANTREWVPRGLDMVEHLRVIGQIAGKYPNTVLEIANEAYHGTQVDNLSDKVLSWRNLIPANVPVADGNADEEHYNAATPGTYDAFDYMTVHSERGNGDSGWRYVRHLRDLEGIQSIHKKPVISDEPIGAAEEDSPGRRSNDPAKFFGMALVPRILEIGGTTFHYEGGLRYGLPTGNQLACFNAWRLGAGIMPDHLNVKYQNSNGGGGWASSPVGNFNFSDNISANTALRAYSGIFGDRGYTFAIREVGDPGIQWANGWTPKLVYRFAARDGSSAALYAISRNGASAPGLPSGAVTPGGTAPPPPPSTSPVCELRWSDLGNWSDTRNVSSMTECAQKALSIGQQHCTEVASGATAEDPSGVTVTYWLQSNSTDKRQVRHECSGGGSPEPEPDPEPVRFEF